MSAYIPTNVISITDGQVYLQDDLFKSGVRPAVDVGISVSRVGGAAQIKAMKTVSGTLKLDLAQFRELEAFASFGSDLDKATLNQLNRGRRLVEVLKQPQYQPLAVEKQVVIIYAATNGYLDPIPVDQLRVYEIELFQFLETRQTALVAALREKKQIDDDVKKALNAALEEFGKSFVGSGKTAAA